MRMRSNWFNVFLLVTLLLGSGLSAAPTSAQVPGPDPVDPAAPPVSAPVEAQPAVNPLYPAEMDPPETCGVPDQAPFGEDVELLLGPNDNYTTSRLDQAARWTPFGGPIIEDYAAISAMSTDQLVMVWKVSTTDLRFSLWSQGQWALQDSLDAGFTMVGNPAVVSRNAKNFVAFVRDDDEYIYYLEWNDGAPGTWQTLPGVYRAASDPVPVVLGPSHVALFFKDTAGNVRFSDWVGGVGWRDQPLSLEKPSGYNLSSDTTAGLAAVSRNENHVAVFALTGNNGLWVREWTSLNASDWSDTDWTALATSGVEPLTPTPVSRHANQMGVAAVAAMSDGSLGARYWEWTATASSSGWKPPVDLPLPASGSLGSPLTMAGTSTDEMWLLGVAKNGTLYSNTWTDPIDADGSWGGWSAVSIGLSWKTSSTPLNWTVTAVVRQPYEVMALAWSSHYDQVIHLGYSTLGQPVTTLTATTQNNTRNGASRAQAIAMVDGEPIWVTLWRNPTYNWIVEAAKTSNWAVGSSQFTLDHPDSGGVMQSLGYRYLIAEDVDADGDDEVIVATLDASRTRIDVSVIELTVGTSSISLAATRTTYTGQPAGIDINVAAGDMDGDGVGNEIVVGYYYYGATGMARTILAQFTGGAWQYKATDDWSLTGYGDLELAIGQVQYGAGEELVIAHAGFYPKYYFYQWTLDQRGNRHLEETVESEELTHVYVSGDLFAALALGDVDADGLQEVVYAVPGTIYVIDGNVNATTYAAKATSVPIERPHALALGDLDRDGREEIVFGYGGGGDIFERVLDSPVLFRTGRFPGLGVPLVADLDDDSFQANLVGCKTISEVKVISVVHGPPLWYENDVPVQSCRHGAANTDEQEHEDEDGWSVNVGSSLSVGFEVEQNIPIFGTKIGEVRGSVTVESMSNVSGAESVRTGTSETQGYSVYDSRGSVIYEQTSYKCYFYDVYRPGEPANAARAMACTPTSEPAELETSLAYWTSQSFKDDVAGSWVDVGDHTNDVTTYPASNPVDPQRIVWEGGEFLVAGDVENGHTRDWSLEQSWGGGSTIGGGFELNTTVSAGVTVGFVTMDAAVTAGYGQNWSRTVSWGKYLVLEGGVENWQKSDCRDYDDDCTPCTTCQPYTWVPYVYRDTGVSEAGATYPYMVVDYYVPSIGALASASASEPAPRAVLAVPPQTPVITSTTHPVSTTWYPTNTVTFQWGQPAGDPAEITGYGWRMTHTPVITRTARNQVLTDTHTYRRVSDGVHYFHLEAQGEGGDYSPIAHRAVRVDANPPQVELTLDPLAPTGLNDWYNTPVTITVTATDTTGSGVTAVEVSEDGSTWQPYSAPLVVASDTPAFTLWARATDAVGHTSTPISTTVKVDLTPPSILDGDGYRLTYASIITDEVGNAQLVLGGALNDALSGRFMTEVKLGDQGAWRAADAVGEFPMPPGNVLPSTMTSLNWVYTPTFEARGAWTIWARGTDAAGGQTEELDIAGFWWEPRADPDLTETQVSVVPAQAAPGDVVTFTLAVRNTGYQECNVALTNTVPAELSVLPDTIRGDGRYDDAAGVINWNLDALWPGETRYVFFSAQVAGDLAPTEPLTVENRLDLLGYWVWEDPYGVLPPAPPTHAEVATTSLTILPDTGALAAQAADASPPAIFSAAVLEGAIVEDPDVTLLIDASANAEFFYVREWVWDTVAATWTLAQESGWIPFQADEGLEVSVGGFGRQGRYQWTLSSGDGVKYLGLWVASGDQQVSQLNDGNMIYTNLASPAGQALSAGQRVQYRVPLRPGDLAIFDLVTRSGDADLYVWKPRFAFRPHFFSNDAQTGFHLDAVGFLAEEERVHIVEVEAVSDGTIYRLVTAGDMAAIQTVDDPLPRSTHLTLAEKDRPAHPLTLSTPYSLADAGTLPESPLLSQHDIYMPLVFR
jgi:uncharacterized repeat protein (TIGR01451 family)